MENQFDYMDDRPYYSNYATLTPGRSFYISLSLKFKSKKIKDLSKLI